MNKFMSKTFNFLGFILGYVLNVFILFLCVYVIYYATLKAFNAGEDFTKKSDEEKPYVEVAISIQEDTPIAEMAQILEEKGLIYNAYIYQLENFLKGNNDPYKTGEYVLNTQMDSSEINRTLRKVIIQGIDKRITISEGRNIKEIAQYLENEGIVTAENFIETCNTGDFKYDFLRDVPYRDNRLEGYLFPDTYFVSENATSSEIIDKMLFRFQQMYDEECVSKAVELGLTMDEVITIASVIEKEISREDERAKAASVIYNRLNISMKLQMCSTVIYILDKHKDRLLDEDLEVESPYNTYINYGLPVGPIGNPGKACIEAALNPIYSDYLYFVVKDEETGEHFFTNDFDEFTNAKIEYKQRF